MTLHSLSIGYNSSAPIVQAIEAELSCGQFICLLGRNGTGKSTLLRTLAGLQEPLEGDFTTHQIFQPLLNPQTSQTFQPHQTPQTSQTPIPPLISLVTPHCPDLQHTIVRELASYGRLPYTGLFGRLSPADLAAADAAIRLIGIEHLSSRYIHTLSDGERQKVLIARALAQGTPYLLLDEPSAFLDYPSRRQLMQLLVHLAHHEHKAILLSTHDVELASQYADRLWIIHDQRLTEKAPQDFSPEEL